jgi:uncharacterized protein YkwD
MKVKQMRTPAAAAALLCLSSILGSHAMGQTDAPPTAQASAPPASAPPASAPDDQNGPSPEEKQLLDLTNDARDSEGLRPLHWDPALAAAAAQHSRLMRGQPELSHQYPGEDPLLTRAAQSGAHFASIAENIAMGPSPGAIEREWLRSVPHRANIFDPKMDAIGISVVRRGGDLYATEDFSQSVVSVIPEQAEAQVAALLHQQGLTIVTDEATVRDARETCEMNQGSAGGTQPHSVVRWESPSLTELPAQLTQRTATGQYKSAAVGSCTSMHPQQGFTTYRIAVLLF